MKKLFLFVMLLLLTGCGHNTALNSKGWGIDISWNQDSYMPTARLGYWDISTAIVKENTQAELTSNSEVGIDNNISKTNGAKGTVGSTVKIKTGQQINGYTKDVLTSPDIKQSNVDMAEKLFQTK